MKRFYILMQLFHSVLISKAPPSITCLTHCPSKSRFTCTTIPIFQVHAGAAIFTWIARTFIDIYNKNALHSTPEMIFFHNMKISLAQYVRLQKLKNTIPVWHSVPVNPLSHAQVYPSSMSVHVPSFSHGLLSHSLMSTKSILVQIFI